VKLLSRKSFKLENEGMFCILYRNNEVLKPSDTIAQTFDGETAVLEIRNADSEVDAGDYKCLAINPVGRASHGARVTVDVDKV
jgi:hypothetical protein